MDGKTATYDANMPMSSRYDVYHVRLSLAF